MAGYKQSLKDMKPLLFLTFDGDTLYNKGTGELIRGHITDESNNGNDGLLQTNTDNRKSYMMGQPSLVQRENSQGQASITFAPYGYDDSGLVDFPFEKSMVEVLHNDSLKLKGDYTISFLMNKVKEDGELRSLKWNEATQKYDKINYSRSVDLYRTIFKKGAQIGAVHVDTYYSTNRMEFSFPAYTWKPLITEFINIDSSFYNKVWHITMSHKIDKLAGNIFQNVYRVYVNGIKHHEHKGAVVTIPYTAENTSPLEIGGNRDGTNTDTLNDRQTTPLTIDQFAIFDRCLLDNEVMSLYKKTVTYDNLILNAKPTMYVKFNDLEYTNSTALKIQYGDSGSYTSKYSHLFPYLEKEKQINSDRVGNETCVHFKGATAKIQHVNNSNVISASGDFSVEFWCGFSGNDRGVIVSCQSNEAPFRGLLIETNRFYDDDRVGMIQVRLDNNTFLTAQEYSIDGSNAYYNDDVVRHYCVTRNGSRLSLYIDGTINSYKDVDNSALVPSNGTLYFMGLAPSDMLVNGKFGNFVFYNRALQDSEINARSFFFTKMILKGRVTLQGQPHKTDMRIYEHGTGELLDEYKTETDGHYAINVYTNNYIDVMFLDKQDSTVQMRVIGPVIAHEYIDTF